MSGELSIFLFLKGQRLFSFIDLGKDLSPHIEKIHFLIAFEVELFGDDFELFIEECFAVLGFFKGIN